MKEENKSTASSGIGIGSVIACIMSWSANHSVFWCIIHGMFGWAYVIYSLCGCAKVAQ